MRSFYRYILNHSYYFLQKGEMDLYMDHENCMVTLQAQGVLVGCVSSIQTVRNIKITLNP